MSRRVLPIKFPTGGLNKRLTYQNQPPYTTPACLNVRPDEQILGRERGGSRPGLGKAYALELGSGNPVRLLATVTYTTGGASVSRLVASANGALYREDPAGTMELVSTSTTLSSSRLLQADDFEGKLYIADYDTAIASGSAGAVTSTNQFSVTGGANIYDHCLVITDGGTGANQIQTVTITGTPTGGSFTLTVVVDGVGYETDPIPYNASAAQVVSRLNAALLDQDGVAVGTVTGGGGALPGSAVTITFGGSLANTDVNLMELNSDGLTGGTLVDGACTITTEGGPAEPGTYNITAVGATLTISPATKNATGVTYRIQRCPKIYDPVANTLTKWVAETGSVPIGRPLFCVWRARPVFAGGDTDPHGWDMGRQGDFLDFDYSQLDEGGAVAGSSSEAGKLQTPCTGLIPHSDECLIFGTIGGLHVARNDPKSGGRITRLSSEIGTIDALCWCYTPEGYLFFLSLDGLYVMAPGCGSTPRSVSREKLPESLLNVDRTTHTVTMRYDVRDRGIHLYVTEN